MQSFQVYNPIKLSCANDMREACLLDQMYCKEVEAPDYLWVFQFFIRCYFCNHIHQVDNMAADFLDRIYEHSVPYADE